MGQGANHIINLVIKAVLFIAVLSFFLLPLPALGLNAGYIFTGVLSLSVALMILSYIIGDLAVLPSYGNAMAVVADAVLLTLGLTLLPRLFGLPTIAFRYSLIIAAVLAAGEYFYHRYLEGQVATVVGALEQDPGDLDEGPFGDTTD